VVHPRHDGDVRQREDGHEDQVGRDDLGRRRRGRGDEAAEPDERQDGQRGERSRLAREPRKRRRRGSGAVGAYFFAWHSVRHVARLVALDDATATPATGLSRFARQAAPPTVAALLLLVAFGRLVPTAPSTVAEAAGLYLVFVAVLTVPHVVVVAWMDRREGVWG